MKFTLRPLGHKRYLQYIIGMGYATACFLHCHHYIPLHFEETVTIIDPFGMKSSHLTPSRELLGRLLETN